MTKKQFGIIFTLMALIAFVGVLAAKLNASGLNDPTDLGQAISQANLEDKKDDKKDDKETLGTQDYFYSLRSEKEQLNSATIQQLKEVIESENTAQEEKDLANNELIEKTMLINQEGQIEISVKNRGFEDALCSIEGNKVRIVVRADELTEDDTIAIQEIAENVSGISDVIIEAK
ncbi:SpoIIIAH-like family protein [Caproiciproducens sp. MSJ-32]|uniref:SpoIIIAH-like family protein n=1 Tax=Caproiciproducens sp. MSJ-32 TaxID=2841527 RepID=UPI001C0FE6E7|nr:SpoIIIAH-like family protein [Caproiciproducens sp. MSJ-32]MBU5454577.1 SpoIIIAH-like family protein [Caproiciproducens sp. MSJ-32]